MENGLFFPHMRLEGNDWEAALWDMTLQSWQNNFEFKPSSVKLPYTPVLVIISILIRSVPQDSTQKC